MNLINNNINRHNNVNFQSVKNVNYKNFKNFPKQGTEMLEAFKNNPNVQNFIKNHDVEINMDVNKIKKGYQKGNYLYSFDVRYIDSDAKANQKSGVLNRIKNFFSKSKLLLKSSTVYIHLKSPLHIKFLAYKLSFLLVAFNQL